MRRIDIVLALLFVGLVVGLVFLPDLIENWSADEKTAPLATVEPAPQTEPESLETAQPLDPAAERERVKGMLMLHQACVARFEDYEARAGGVVESWKDQNAEILSGRGAEPDFHIVLGDPQGLEEEAARKAMESTRELCEGNLAAMREEVETASTP